MAPIRTFLDEHVVINNDAYIPVDDMYVVFRSWAEKIGIAEWAKNRLTAKIHELLGGTTRPMRPSHERQAFDSGGKPTEKLKTRERVIAGISWSRPPTELHLWQLRDLYLNNDI